MPMTIFRKKSKTGRLKLPNFDTYSKAKLLNIVWYRHKNGQIQINSRIRIRKLAHTFSVN